MNRPLTRALTPVLGLALALALAIAAAGCGGAQVPLLTGNGGFEHPTANPDGLLPIVGCYTNFASGELIVDRVNGTAIVDGSVTLPIRWPEGYTGRQAGSEVEVLDGAGKVVAITGRRYQIEGGTQPAENGDPRAFLACGYVLPK